MKIIFSILISMLYLSCHNANDTSSIKIKKDTNKATTEKISSEQVFSVNPTDVLKDFNSWYNYNYYNVILSQDFVGLNIDSSKIDKETFLNKLMTGKEVAFKIKQLQDRPVYKLYTLNIKNENIKSTIEQLASIELKNYKMQGKQIPEFNFTDLNGRNYSSISTKGKIIILKCWFIHCVACVQEFPDCNELVNEYKNRNDILFISLASDTKAELKKFFKTKPFNYLVIPQTDNYMSNKLNINMYPTHMLIDKKGEIVKVVNSIKELEPFLKIEAEK